ncbi:MAG: site-specific integrase [Pseudonocardiaceae bacterium]
MRVIKHRDGGIVRRVELVDEHGEPIGSACRFLNHLVDRGFSPHTLCAYAYDLKYLFTFLDQENLDWQGFRAPDRCGCWPSCGVPRPDDRPSGWA